MLEKNVKKMWSKSVHALDEWISKNGWAGYDPYDIKGTPLFLKLQKTGPTTFLGEFILKYFSRQARKILTVKPMVNAKAMAIFGRGYLGLYKHSGDEKYLKNAIFCLNWLSEHPSKGYSGLCWGYPFDWQSRIFIPKGTPSGVVTSIAAHAFLDGYELLNERRYLDAAKSSCSFLSNDLNIDTAADDEICFSYTPIDNFHVHNANLFSASALLRISGIVESEKYRDMGIKAFNFTVNRQNEDGSWYYWAPPDKLLYNIDNYHTGFVIECLNVARRALKDEFEHEDALRKGLRFYADNLFLNDGTPKLKHNSVYPIDIHSCAQGIITFCELADFEPKYLKMAHKAAEWSMNNMQDEKGYFYYRVYKHRVDRTPYIRWGQAWMLRALPYLLGGSKC